MKSLDSQIRLHKWHVDEARRHLGELERLVARLNADIDLLDRQVAEEKIVAGRQPEMAMTFHAYLEEARARRDRLCRSVDEVNEQISQARDALQSAFGDLKKFEIAAATAEARAQRLRDMREQQQLDEVGLSLYRRRGR